MRPLLSSLFNLDITLYLMKFLAKVQNWRPAAKSSLWACRRRKAKQPKFVDKDLEQVAEFDMVFDHDPRWSSNYVNAYIEDEDYAMSISSFSTNATMDSNPGAGVTIDKYFYQICGRAIERLALKVSMRLNIYHPSPAQILRCIGMCPGMSISRSYVKKPSDVIDAISAGDPSAVPGILSLVQQSQ